MNDPAKMTPGEYTLAFGGGTFVRDRNQFRPINPKAGYAVGLAAGTAYIVEPVVGTFEFRAAIRAGMEQVEDMYPDTSFIGTWTAPGGAIHVDPVRIVKDRDEAILLAKALNQQAIWDFANSEEIK